MSNRQVRQSNRYINDLRRVDYQHGEVKKLFSGLLPFVLAALFLCFVGIYGSLVLNAANENMVIGLGPFKRFAISLTRPE